MSSCRNPDAHRFRVALLLVPSAVFLSGCAHSNLPPPPVPAQEAAAMTAPVAPTDNPTLTAEEVGTRFLKLIEGLESRSDLTPERVQQTMGISLEARPDTLGTVIWSEDLGDGWRYAFDYIPASPSLLQGVGLSFENEEDGYSDMTVICGLGFDDYHSALKAMGFRDTPIHGEIGQLQSWRYDKNDITISIIPQNVVAGVSGRLCVKSIGTLN